ncbi:hypothetical protein DP939_25235 [Spongiactinospora rosea]|uniref:TrbC/VIRB2 family protein n=1 Tax=Spongiactinospora rosea TaxID=2248750 RepID=A0A366LUN4_9ACTN|nr:pilin [Spongiactinospora rosea]RBQ17253.1 hypothetical protein DP939_25235 [Spongiactinospora rosea]
MSRRRILHTCSIAAAVAAVMALVAVFVILIWFTTAPASLATPQPSPLASPPSLTHVVDNLRNWLVGLLVTFATLMLTIGGIRYLLSGGDPGEVAKAKSTLRMGAFGYAIAALAPLLVKILSGIVGV